jgi:hypothetical protein
MRQFHIHHATDPSLRFTETEKQPRVYASFVEAESLNDAFMLSQNDFNPNWSTEDKPLRSTSVGDIIQDGDDFHMVLGIGFRLLN